MTTLTINNFNDAMEKQLQIKAKQHNRSTEDEIYHILKKALFPIENKKKLGSILHAQIMEITSGIDLELPNRSLPRTAPDFSNTSK